MKMRETSPRMHMVRYTLFRNTMAIYLLHGDSKSTDSYEIRQRLDALLKGIDREGNLNFSVYDLSESGTSFADVVASALTIPFLGGQRVVVATGLKKVEKIFQKPEKDEDESESNLSGSAESILRAVEQLGELPDDALLIFVEENSHLDGRTAFYRALKKVGCRIEKFKAMFFDPASGSIRDAVEFIQTQASRLGIRLNARVAEQFALRVGSDRGNLLKELEKLALYAGQGASPTVEDVENVVTKCYEAGIFQLVDYLGLGRIDKALLELSDLLDHGAAAPYILVMIARQIRLIALAREAIQRGVPRDQGPMAKELGIHPFVAGKVINQCRTFRKFSYPRLLEYLIEADVQIKRGTMPSNPPGKLALETLIIRLAGGTQSGGGTRR